MASETLDAKAAWALADRVMSISYSYAVKMHESIEAGKGAQGWNEVKHAAEIRSAIGDALAEVEKLRGENERLTRVLAGVEKHLSYWHGCDDFEQHDTAEARLVTRER